MTITPTKEALSVMARLRPPSARPLRLVYSFRQESYRNPGYTFELQEGEQPVCPGNGVIISLVRRFTKAKFTSDLLYGTTTYELVISHGAGVKSVVSGFKTVRVRVGEAVSRGDALGDLVTREVFFGVSYNDETFEPGELSRHWHLQGSYVLGQEGMLRFAPDRIVRDFAGTVASMLFGGIRYFVNRVTGFEPLLLNVDFNGDGSKAGFAATGVTNSDYWNVFAPGAFSWIEVKACSYYGYAEYQSSGNCGNSKAFNVNPQTWLKDSAGRSTPVWLERIEAASNAHGSLGTWDSMLSSWIGGWALRIPYRNSFAIRGLVPGNYRVYLYANTANRTPDGNTLFYAALNSDTLVQKHSSVWHSQSYASGYNYVTYDFTVTSGDVIVVKADGYFDGIQIERLA